MKKFFKAHHVCILSNPDSLTIKINLCKKFLQMLEKDYLFQSGCTLQINRTKSLPHVTFCKHFKDLLSHINNFVLI